MSEIPTLASRNVLLIICGGIAAYKSLDLIRRLRERGANVKAVVTEAGEKFVTPLSVSALTGNHVNNDLLDHGSEADFGHIELARWADVIVVAPATADFIATMASGHGRDLASALILASQSRILCAPAMNVHMWTKPATVRNMSVIAGDGIVMVGPVEGEMACGDYGMGRMSEPVDILAAIEGLIHPVVTTNLSAIVTTGPTREAIDPVRFISNRSSGKQGIEIARALHARGVAVTLVLGPIGISPVRGPECLHVESAVEMRDAVIGRLPVDIFVGTAAVADWRMEQPQPSKMKKTADSQLTLEMVENPDILASVANHHDDRPRLVIGFAAETDNLLENARRKRTRKGCDWLLANDVGHGSDTFGGDDNSIILLDDIGEETWPRMSKRDVADRLADRIIGRLTGD